MTTVRLRLPATSANLGSGFDALALALDLHLDIEAEPAERFSLSARGRNPEICGKLENHLLIETYRAVLSAERLPAPPLAIRMRNDIPLGMGCGSSAAVRLAGIALAVHSAGLAWDGARIVDEAARREGHPDNVAACWYGGLTVAARDGSGLAAVSISPPCNWRALLVLPQSPVATVRARSVLPDAYSREDVVANLQCVALLTAAFALGRADLLPMGSRDRLHQPYRGELCPLLPALLPLAGSNGVLSVTLSGAGPAVLLLLDEVADAAHLQSEITKASSFAGPVELLEAGLAREGASVSRVV